MGNSIAGLVFVLGVGLGAFFVVAIVATIIHLVFGI